MCYFKKATAMLLALIMMLSVAMCANAQEVSSSPTGAPTNPPTNPTTPTVVDDHHYQNAENTTDLYVGTSGEQIGFDISGNNSIVWNVCSNKPNAEVLITASSTATGEVRPVKQLGSGTYGLGGNKDGENVTGIGVVTSSPVLVVATKALSNSYIRSVALQAPSILFQKNVCQGTKVKKVTFWFPTIEKAEQISVSRNAFKGAKRVTIKVPTKMSKKELNKLKKKIKKKNKGVKLKFVRM